MTSKSVFEFEMTADVLIVTPNGPLMEFRDDDIRHAYNESYRILSEPGIRHLLMDFSRLDYFGSTFVGILYRLARKARTRNGDAALCHLSDNMKDMLKSLMLLENPKIDFSFTPHVTRQVALQHLAAASQLLKDA